MFNRTSLAMNPSYFLMTTYGTINLLNQSISQVEFSGTKEEQPWNCNQFDIWLICRHPLVLKNETKKLREKKSHVKNEIKQLLCVKRCIDLNIPFLVQGLV